MTARTSVHRLQVATELHRFIEEQVLPGTGVDPAAFWQGFDALVHDLAPKNQALLAERDRLQGELDRWHQAHPGPIQDMQAYRAFLEQIGYLVPPPAGVQASTTNVDAELALQAGPQLVVPILNARYALNAANARWGSLYDALYGTDAIPETGGAEKGPGYNEVRGAKVIDYARDVLDQAAPLAAGSHRDAVGYRVEGGQLRVALKGGASSGLKDPAQFVGYQGEAGSPSSVLLKHHGLHIDILIDRTHADRQHRPGRRHRRGDGSGAVHHPRPGRLGGGGRRAGQGAGLPQLAGHPQGRPDRAGQQGRQAPSPAASTPTASTPRRPAAPSRCMAARCCSCATSAT